jgi:hypothetical protein
VEWKCLERMVNLAVIAACIVASLNPSSSPSSNVQPMTLVCEEHVCRSLASVRARVCWSPWGYQRLCNTETILLPVRYLQIPESKVQYLTGSKFRKQ